MSEEDFGESLGDFMWRVGRRKSELCHRGGQIFFQFFRKFLNDYLVYASFMGPEDFWPNFIGYSNSFHASTSVGAPASYCLSL